MDLSVVVPVYNEEESVALLCEKLHAAVSGLGIAYEIVLVDDGSDDRTWELLKELSHKYPCLRLIQFRRNFGQTAAMSAGFRESKGEVVVTLDADLQNDPADIPKLLELMKQGNDVVSGWRKDRKDPFINRRLPSILANALISKITGVYLHDYGCTLKAYRRAVMQNVHLYGEMHRFIPALANWVGGKVTEVPVNHQARQFGTSKYGIARTFKVVLDLFTVKFLLQYSKGPMQIFGKIGMWFGVPGILAVGWMVVAHLSYLLFGTEVGSMLVKRPFWVIGSFMLIFCGIQFVCIGLLAELQIRTWHESQDKPIYVIKEIVEPTSEA
ncbi:MAG: glycosyltransferase family 2 protein [Verrucomicrobia bacterium]|jgi:glycosyltransferase involved in cell wall biosynthesis|nr:glycosyltransferase family 2 protein [Verrucomicrobiota bacterium]MBT7065171.1 glycosyltransferase family 2 protein [Verrucomicrobiota bacterium]MBT7699380.1 glycosyltransferase family 2 protein [Verrucomicrobiota bacterium]